MTPQEIDARLVQTLEDRHLSRGERQALSEFVAALGTQVDREAIRHRAFALACAALRQWEDQPILDWLEDVVKALREGGTHGAHHAIAEAYFSPGEDCLHAIRRVIANARRTADICVFTITDDRLSDALLDAHHRGVSVRIISDNAKAEDLGSDVGRFEEAGVSVRVDRSPFHMHHKFAILDGATLLTGSYNWTRGAAHDNAENVIVVNDPRLLSSFNKTFEHLWKSLG